MPPDVLERFVDDVESTRKSETPDRAGEPASLTASLAPFAALRARIAEHADAFQAWEPVYKHLRAHPAELAKLLDRVREARSAAPSRGLAYRAARDALLRDWALEQLDVDTRALLASLESSREALRRDATLRVEAYLRAEAELRFRALAALACVGAAVDPERAAARRVLTGRAADEAAKDGTAAGEPTPRLPWRAATLASAVLALPAALGALAVGAEPVRAAALGTALATLPILVLPRWVARTWADFHAGRAALHGLAAATTPAPPPPIALSAKQERAVRAALESTTIAPTAAHVGELLDALGFASEDVLEPAASVTHAHDLALPFGAAEPSLRDAARSLREVCSVARVARLVPETPAATAFVRGFIDNARALQALCAGRPGAASVLGAAAFEVQGDLLPNRAELPDAALDALVAALDELGYGLRDELDARRVGALRVSIERMPEPIRGAVESAIFERLDARCRRFTSSVTAWCERMAERSQLAAIEGGDGHGTLDEEPRIAELDDLVYRVRLTEIRSDEVRRDLAEAARASSRGGAAQLAAAAPIAAASAVAVAAEP